MQRKGRPGEVLEPVPAIVSGARWSLECSVRGADLTGPYVDGRPGARFIYLSWQRDAANGYEMFRRAKLMLDAVPGEVLDQAVAGGVLVATLGLTDEKGGPLCAAVRPPLVQWSARDDRSSA